MVVLIVLFLFHFVVCNIFRDIDYLISLFLLNRTKTQIQSGWSNVVPVSSLSWFHLEKPNELKSNYIRSFFSSTILRKTSVPTPLSSTPWLLHLDKHTLMLCEHILVHLRQYDSFHSCFGSLDWTCFVSKWACYFWYLIKICGSASLKWKVFTEGKMKMSPELYKWIQVLNRQQHMYLFRVNRPELNMISKQFWHNHIQTLFGLALSHM